MEERSPILSVKAVFFCWMPLAATWLMMALEQPMAGFFISRLQRPEENLAAFGVALGLIYFFESPFYAMLSAGTTLGGDRTSFRRLRIFCCAFAAAVSLMLALLLTPAAFNIFGMNVMHLPKRVSDAAGVAALLMFPTPFFVAYRRLWQGILVRQARTAFVAYGTILRVIVMLAVSGALFFLDGMTGVCLAALARTTAVVAESICIRSLAGRLIGDLPEKALNAEPICYSGICRFYFPLAVTGIVLFLNIPMLTFFMARSIDPLLSLAAFPVLHGSIFLFISLTVSFQEVVVAMIGESHQGFWALSRFARRLGISITLALLLITNSQLGAIWLTAVMGLKTELAAFSMFAARFGALLPVAYLGMMFQRGILTRERVTNPVTIATLLDIAAQTALMAAAVSLGNFSGLTAAFLSLLVGRFVSVCALLPAYSRARAKPFY